MIGGSIAAIFYGEPRLTLDVAFVSPRIALLSRRAIVATRLLMRTLRSI